MRFKDPIKILDSLGWRRSLNLKLTQEDTSSPIVFISGSHGSKIAFDVLTNPYTYLDSLSEKDAKNPRIETRYFQGKTRNG